MQRIPPPACFPAFLLALALFQFPSLASAQDNVDGQAVRIKRFAERMSGVKLIGRFTIDGKDQKELPQEEYVIQSADKLPDGDFWVLTARIKYADKDLTLPLPPLEVKWAGDTPMISITNFTIPGLGTFSARVLFYGDRYAGTWQHGEVGGCMFGVFKKLDAEEASPEKSAKQADPTSDKSK